MILPALSLHVHDLRLGYSFQTRIMIKSTTQGIFCRPFPYPESLAVSHFHASRIGQGRRLAQGIRGEYSISDCLDPSDSLRQLDAAHSTDRDGRRYSLFTTMLTSSLLSSSIAYLLPGTTRGLSEHCERLHVVVASSHILTRLLSYDAGGVD